MNDLLSNKATCADGLIDEVHDANGFKIPYKFVILKQK